MAKKSYSGKYKGQIEIGYKNGRSKLLSFWINLNLIINVAIIAGMISAVFSLEGAIGSSSISFIWARWVLYAIIALYILLFIGLVVKIRREIDDSRALMSLFNYRSISVITRKIITIVYTVFICFLLVDSWVSGVVGSPTLILVIGILIIAFYVLMIAVDVLKIVLRRKMYENTKKKRRARKGAVQSMKRDIECQRILVEHKIIEMRALKNSMVFRLLSINKNRYKQSESVLDELDAVLHLEDPTPENVENTADNALPTSMSEPTSKPEADVFEDKVITMEELQEGVVTLPEIELLEEEIAESEAVAETASAVEVVDENQVTFDELANQDHEERDVALDREDDVLAFGISSLSRDFADIFAFKSRTGV